MERLDRILASITALMARVAGFAMILMVLHIVLDVAVKYVFNKPLFATVQVTEHYYMVPMVFGSLVYLESLNGHIKVEIFTLRLPARARRFIDGITSLMMAAFMALFSVVTYQQAIVSSARFELVEAATTTIYIWPARWVLPVCGTVAALIALRRGVDFLWFRGAAHNINGSPGALEGDDAASAKVRQQGNSL